MSSISFTPFPVLSAARLKLRELREEDENEILFFRSDARILKYICMSPANTIQEAKNFISKINKGVTENEWRYWGITTSESDTLIGTICIWNISRENQRGELGYTLSPDFWGKGYMKEALDAVVEYGFKKMKLHTLCAHTSPENAASIQLLKKCGFLSEAHFRDYEYFEGKYYDTAVFTKINRSDD